MNNAASDFQCVSLMLVLVLNLFVHPLPLRHCLFTTKSITLTQHALVVDHEQKPVLQRVDEHCKRALCYDSLSNTARTLGAYEEAFPTWREEKRLEDLKVNV